MEKSNLKLLIEALVIHQSYDGIIPSWSAYQDREAEIQADIDSQVDDILLTYKILKDSQVEFYKNSEEYRKENEC